MSKKVLVKQESTEVGFVMEAGAFGDGGLSSRDIIIPKILAMQGLSELVTAGKAKFGDFCDSVSGEVIGNINDKPVEFIPFLMEKLWCVSQLKGKKFEFVKFEAVTSANEGRQFEEGDMRYEYTLKFYVLNPKDMGLPYIISFKSTSRRTGQEIATQMFIKNKVAGKYPPSKTFLLSGIKETNDNGTYVVMKASVNRDSTNEELSACLDWYKTIKGGLVKDDDSDLKKPTAPKSSVLREVHTDDDVQF